MLSILAKYAIKGEKMKYFLGKLCSPKPLHPSFISQDFTTPEHYNKTYSPVEYGFCSCLTNPSQLGKALPSQW